ncbi:ATP-binding protein, partial [Vibrio fluvialis]|nr:ATP-binding protein [Vibrio fluvialis]
HNQYENELATQLNKLRAEHSKIADDYLIQAKQQSNGQPLEAPTTDLERLWTIWGELFPQRQIIWNGYNISAKSYHSINQNGYEPNDMSGGEKAALYLLVKVLTAPENALLVIDEPELHFHSLLAQQFWSKMEDLRPDCRFVYITHDLPFSASRNSPKYILVSSPNQHQVLKDSDLPQDIYLKILGTNTYSITSSNVVFIEGKTANSPDIRLYKQWFSPNDPNRYIIMPVESCDSVIKHTTSFNEANIIPGVKAIGIIDRDYRTDVEIQSLTS